MFCPNCGTKIEVPAASCAHCGASLPGPSTGPPATPPPFSSVVKIPNYLVQSILVTLCCCLPPGIVAIVFAAQVNGKIALGQIDEARRYSRMAYVWSWVSFGAGVLVTLFYLLLLLAGEIKP